MTTAIVQHSNERWANLIYRTSKIDFGFEFNKASTSGDKYIKLFGRDDAHLEISRLQGQPKLVLNNGSTRRVSINISEKDYEKLRREIDASPIEVRR